MLSSQQLTKYLAHISAPDLNWGDRQLKTLETLQKYHQAKVPFENLSLHYSRHHVLSLDVQDLYTKVVVRGMGGYCMEANTFFGAVMRSFGFTLFSAAGRVSGAVIGRPDRGYSGWSHMVNIVIIDGQRYLVDVGFGSDGPIRPLPLVHDGYTCCGIAPQLQRIEYKNLPQHSDPSQRVWVYSFRANEHALWTEAYSFTEIEFFPQDYEVMNLSTMTTRQSFFTHAVLCMKTILGASGEVEGLLILFGNEVKKRIEGVATVVEKLESEEQRVKALEKWFGIVLTEQEKNGIRGLVTELRG